MGIDNFIELALRSVLKNPILGVLREINVSKILIQIHYAHHIMGPHYGSGVEFPLL